MTQFYFRVALNLDLRLQTPQMQPDLHLTYPVDFYRAKQILNSALLHAGMLLSLQKENKARFCNEIDALPPHPGLSSAPQLCQGITPATWSQLDLNRYL